VGFLKVAKEHSMVSRLFWRHPFSSRKRRPAQARCLRWVKKLSPHYKLLSVWIAGIRIWRIGSKTQFFPFLSKTFVSASEFA